MILRKDGIVSARFLQVLHDTNLRSAAIVRHGPHGWIRSAAYGLSHERVVDHQGRHFSHGIDCKIVLASLMPVGQFYAESQRQRVLDNLLALP